MENKKSLVIILPDGTEHFCEADIGRFKNYHNVATDVVYKAGLTTSHDNPQRAIVKVYELTIVNGEIKRNFIKTCDVELPFAKLTEAEYEAKLEYILVWLPPAFRSFVSSQAWERGHSGGYEEVLLIADDLTDGLKVAIMEYERQKIGGSTK